MPAQKFIFHRHSQGKTAMEKYSYKNGFSVGEYGEKTRV